MAIAHDSRHVKPMNFKYTNVAFYVIAAAVIALMTSSCGTVSGFGSDVRAVGHEIEHASN